MLAPEEVYKSAGIVKGESELTPEERKRRRAQKKRKRKGFYFVTFHHFLFAGQGLSIISKGKIALALFVNHFKCM